MGRPKRWRESPSDNGVTEVRLHNWKYFSDYINQRLLNATSYIFRGHGDAEWLLEPSLDRIIKTPTSPKREQHLDRFKRETRGRRGQNPAPLETENDWWALGQHHGLSTPLLDWTRSPFVALYFAAEAALRSKPTNLAVHAVSEISIERRSKAIKDDEGVERINNRPPTVKVVQPDTNENSRLVNQRGLFTRGPNNVDLETWFREFGEGRPRTMELIKIVVPFSGIQDCMKYLNRMNINHATLFPDLTGASQFCNQHLEVARY